MKDDSEQTQQGEEEGGGETGRNTLAITLATERSETPRRNTLAMIVATAGKIRRNMLAVTVATEKISPEV